ncbi:tripeptidyl peptidase A [Panaeolus papilionaceus]|nr:tripeptidyl peptidase A [Panaeolus papilionaceus]
MKFFSSRLLALLQTILVVAAAPRFDAFAVKETVHVPRGWTRYAEPSADHNVVLQIGLPQPNFNLVEQHLWEISDPDHERYGQHLSKEEAEALVRPPPESSKAVHEWLASAGVHPKNIKSSPAGDWITINVPVHQAEKMLDTKYYIWTHDTSKDALVRTTKYSLPSHMHNHIDLIQPTTMFGRLSRHSSTIFDLVDNLGLIHDPETGITIDASCNATITISCLEQLYNTEGFKATTSHLRTQNSIGITGYLEQFANIQDLQSFYAEQRPDALNSSFSFISVAVGGINSQNLSQAGSEANLDVQFAFGLSHPIPATFFSTAGRPPFNASLKTPTNTNEPYLDWLNAVSALDNPPSVVSTSYGDDEQTAVPESFARRVCQGFGMLGARGVSLIFSSGDGGVGDGRSNPATQQCFTNDGTNTTRFIPTFPSSCPFVTSVGGTNNIMPEVAVSRFFSGGGFSNYFKRPDYQHKAVSGYLNKHLAKGTYDGLFNPEGRGFPDVAAQGDRFRVWVKGVPRSIGGTSASSPAFAGIVALLNDVRIQAGKPPLGFLNPMLYSRGFHGLTDILSGHNSGCGTLGFNVTEGWDPVTGLGTPNFGKLKEIVLEHGL